MPDIQLYDATLRDGMGGGGLTLTAEEKLRGEKVVRVTREEDLAMIADSVAFLVGAGKRVLLDAEHFFDGFALDPAYSIDCLRAAADAGAERLLLGDTNGGSLPPHIRTAFAVVSEALPGTPLGIHTH